MPSITVTEVESNKFIGPKSDHNKSRVTSSYVELGRVVTGQVYPDKRFLRNNGLAPVNHGVDNLTLNAGASGRSREWNPHQSTRGVHSNTPMIR